MENDTTLAHNFLFMEITISTKNLLDDLGGQFLGECNTTDPIPPKGQLIQFLNEAYASLTTLLYRFLIPNDETKADDSLVIDEAYYFNLALTPRRGNGKMSQIADVLHSYLINAALGKYYLVNNLVELSNKRNTMAGNDLQTLNGLLRSKYPPSL